MNLEVRDAHLPAEIHQRHGTYEYLPTEDRVNVTIRCHLQPHLGTTYSIPRVGWQHESCCSCQVCLRAA